MISLTGEYECRLDERGRVKFPQKLIDSLGELKHTGFIVNRGFEKNLAIYPKTVWEQKTKEINQLNIYDKKHREAIRYFYRGEKDLLLDSADGVNVPGNLLTYAGIEKDAVLFAYKDFIELWSKEEYEHYLSSEPDSFDEVIQGVFGNKPDFLP